MGEKVINGDTYKVDAVLATRAMKLQARLLKAAGPIATQLPSIIAAADKGATEEQRAKANSALIAAIGQVFAEIDPDEFASLVKDIVELAKIRRQSGAYDPVDFDGDFSSRLSSVIPVSAFVLKEVFGDFFTGLQGLGGR